MEILKLKFLNATKWKKIFHNHTLSFRAISETYDRNANSNYELTKSSFRLVIKKCNVNRFSIQFISQNKLFLIFVYVQNLRTF